MCDKKQSKVGNETHFLSTATCKATGLWFARARGTKLRCITKIKPLVEPLVEQLTSFYEHEAKALDI